MDQETLNILEKQITLLPPQTVEYIISGTWKAELVAIGLDNGLDSSFVEQLKREVILVLAGFVHPDDFRDELRKALHLDKGVLSRLVPEIEERIFKAVKNDLVGFRDEQKILEKRAGEIIQTMKESPEGVDSEEFDGQVEAIPTPNPSPEKAPKEKILEQIPENLPTGAGVPETYAQTEVFIPELAPKQTTPEEKPEPPHPFEQKMKQVLGGNSTPQTDFKIEPQTPKTADPYREPVE